MRIQKCFVGGRNEIVVGILKIQDQLQTDLGVKKGTQISMQRMC